VYACARLTGPSTLVHEPWYGCHVTEVIPTWRLPESVPKLDLSSIVLKFCNIWIIIKYDL
jgi:hypothetical protein